MVELQYISEGNEKTGCFSFDLPSKRTCPGKTNLCSSKCYAALLEKIYPAVAKKYDANLEFTYSDNFVAYMVLNIPQGCEFRIHVSGDFYSEEYIAKWSEIVKARPDVTFYAYTRSWRTNLWSKIQELSASSNININLSLDNETCKPEVENAEDYRWCFLTEDDNVPNFLRTKDIVFRTKHNGKPGNHKWKRNRAIKQGLNPDVVAPLMHRLGGGTVCPFERGKDMPDSFSCSKCSLCIKKPSYATTA